MPQSYAYCVIGSIKRSASNHDDRNVGRRVSRLALFVYFWLHYAEEQYIEPHNSRNFAFENIKDETDLQIYQFYLPFIKTWNHQNLKSSLSWSNEYCRFSIPLLKKYYYQRQLYSTQYVRVLLFTQSIEVTQFVARRLCYKYKNHEGTNLAAGEHTTTSSIWIVCTLLVRRSRPRTVFE